MKKLTNSEYIQKAKAIHYSRFNYDQCQYTTMHEKIVITCIEHNQVFSVSALGHLKPTGACPLCTKKAQASTHLISTNDFIKRAKAAHGDRYDYSKSVYTNNQHKLEIICSDHGSFWSTPNNHYGARTSNGCPSCGKEKPQKPKRTTEWFINKALSIHGNKYDYSKSNYIRHDIHIEIGCDKHGIFKQTAAQHFAATNCCPQCTHTVSKVETEWLDSLKIPSGFRQKRIFIDGEHFIVDAIDYRTNTVYEFYGDYWHGNPSTTDHTKFNDRANATYGELYTKTLRREKILKENGYTIVAIWESDWKKAKRELKLNLQLVQ